MRNYGQTPYTPPEEATTESTDDDLDEIEIISTQIIHLEAPITPSERLTSTSETREEEAKRKRINRVVGFCATLIFLTCIALVCSTLMMSKNIDELVRNSNELLRNKGGAKSTPGPPQRINISNSTSS